jgi:hypothetical protein
MVIYVALYNGITLGAVHSVRSINGLWELLRHVSGVVRGLRELDLEEKREMRIWWRGRKERGWFGVRWWGSAGGMSYVVPEHTAPPAGNPGGWDHGRGVRCRLGGRTGWHPGTARRTHVVQRVKGLPRPCGLASRSRCSKTAGSPSPSRTFLALWATSSAESRPPSTALSIHGAGARWVFLSALRVPRPGTVASHAE